MNLASRNACPTDTVLICDIVPRGWAKARGAKVVQAKRCGHLEHDTAVWQIVAEHARGALTLRSIAARRRLGGRAPHYSPLGTPKGHWIVATAANWSSLASVPARRSTVNRVRAARSPCDPRAPVLP